MTEEKYRRCIGFVGSSKIRRTAFAIVYKYLPIVFFAAYPVVLIYLLINGSDRLIFSIVIPAVMFITLSAARYFINAPRPYEVYGITPIFAKDTKGKSFPSRHTACAVMIAMTILSVSLPIGFVFCAAAILIAASRVVGGVHFPRDVIAGTLYAVLWGAVLFIV